VPWGVEQSKAGGGRFRVALNSEKRKAKTTLTSTTRGYGRPKAVAGDRRGEAVTGPQQRGHACGRSDRGARLSGRCN
jgi:hypothetical protein